MCWYSQSAADTRLTHSPLVPLGQVDKWLAKASPFSIQVVCWSFLELWRLNHSKICIADRQWGSNFPRKEENQYTKRKTKSYVFSGFGISISFGWEWKSTTGGFATGRFWPFTWKTSSVGKDKVNKWEFCKLKITTIVVFVIMIQRIFPSQELAPMHFTIVIRGLSIHFFSFINEVGFSSQ